MREAAYRDPLDEVWIGAARRIGFTIVRSGEAYASTDGRGTIAFGTPDTLDADDCLAQMILHELCHALVEGEDGWRRADWGLDNQTMRDEPRERACLRLQAALATRHGLRRMLAATTDHRPFYDALPVDPLGAAQREEDAILARLGWQRSQRAPFAPHLEDALAATAEIARTAARFAGATSLLATIDEPPASHPVGFPRRASETCGSCAWRNGAKTSRCRQAGGKRVEAAWGACERWEPLLDCQACGACCREAYHSVEVGARERVVKSHPELILVREGYLELAREGNRCAALSVEGEHCTCQIYDDRPRTCRDFTRSSANCLDARRRVGLSR